MAVWKSNTQLYKIYKGNQEVTKVYKGTMEAYANRRFIDPTLVLYLDSGYRESYPREGTSWYNLVDNSAATLVNGVSYVNTDPKYMSLDGSDDYITVIGDGDDAGYNLQTFTLETWVYVPSGNLNDGTTVFSFSQTGFGYAMDIQLESQSSREYWRFLSNNAGSNTFYATGTSTLTMGGWQQLVVTRTPTTVKQYKNGSLSQSHSFSSYTINYSTSQPVYLGARGYDLAGKPQCYMSVVRLYNRELDSTEINTNFIEFKGRHGL